MTASRTTVHLLRHGEVFNPDKVLYGLIPAKAQSSWDELRPKGLVDLDLKYHSGGKTENGEKDEKYEVKIIPRELAVLPVVIPYRMEKVSGEILVTPQKVSVNNIVARHDDAIIRMNGVGLDKDGHTAWDLQLAGEKLPVDDELRAGIPAGMSSRTSIRYAESGRSRCGSPSGTRWSCRRATRPGRREWSRLRRPSVPLTGPS